LLEHAKLDFLVDAIINLLLLLFLGDIVPYEVALGVELVVD